VGVICTPSTSGPTTVVVVVASVAFGARGKPPRPSLDPDPPQAPAVSSKSTRATNTRLIVPPYSLISPLQSVPETGAVVQGTGPVKGDPPLACGPCR
jgi:hypothetical protein